MKIGDEVWIHGYIDEMRKDIAIIKNEGGYFGAVYDEIVETVEAVNKAYENGFKMGQADIGNVEVAYHQGLNDAWELARKLTHPNYGGLTLDQKEKIFSRPNSDSILMDFTPEEAIKRMKESEKTTPIIPELDALCQKYGTTYGGLIEILEEKLD